MSLLRLVHYSAFIAGWAAFFGWLVSELLLGPKEPDGAMSKMITIALRAGLVGAAIGVGLNLVAGLANAQWKQLLRRALPGLIGGYVGGAIGGIMGQGLYSAGLPRVIGWVVFGLGVGVVEGVYEGSKSKIRNGLIGGGIGGLIGGLLFGPIYDLIGTDMSSRATGFVILGVCIGAMIGLAQVVLKDAWLTVLDGYRAGRQLILSQQVTVLGKAEHLPLPFLGPMNKDLEPEHLKIMRQPSGSFVMEDNHSRLGTRLNNKPAQGQIALKDGDVIKFGTNFVRFNERHRKSGAEAPAVQVKAPAPVRGAPPVPVVRKPSGPSAPLKAPAPSLPGRLPVDAGAQPDDGFYLTPAPTDPSISAEGPAPAGPAVRPAAPRPQAVPLPKPVPSPPAKPGAAGPKPPGGIAPPPPPRRPKS